MPFLNPKISIYDSLHSDFNFGFGDLQVKNAMIETWVELAESQEAAIAFRDGLIGAPWNARELN